ncbi:MAG: hypothetical protein HC827_03165 [Cyanobacteria bacterium RM1_2_2]|nr:hypothetical protein [Cyanobacteria bacterium RM1_2_2]
MSIMTEYKVYITPEDWFNRGKEDAWSGHPKQAPCDPQAASLYDLGYSEGKIQRSPTLNQ